MLLSPVELLGTSPAVHQPALIFAELPGLAPDAQFQCYVGHKCADHRLPYALAGPRAGGTWREEAPGWRPQPGAWFKGENPPSTDVHIFTFVQGMQVYF